MRLALAILAALIIDLMGIAIAIIGGVHMFTPEAGEWALSTAFVSLVAFIAVISEWIP